MPMQRKIDTQTNIEKFGINSIDKTHLLFMSALIKVNNKTKKRTNRVTQELLNTMDADACEMCYATVFHCLLHNIDTFYHADSESMKTGINKHI